MTGPSSALLEAPASSHGVKAINRHNGLAEEAYAAIFAQLMALRIAPGSRITVDNLVRDLNVSISRHFGDDQKHDFHSSESVDN